MIVLSSRLIDSRAFAYHSKGNRAWGFGRQNTAAIMGREEEAYYYCDNKNSALDRVICHRPESVSFCASSQKKRRYSLHRER